MKKLTGTDSKEKNPAPPTHKSTMPPTNDQTTKITGHDERRRYPRLKYKADVSFTILIPTETFSPYNYKAFTTDLSMGGLCMKTGQIDRKNFQTLIREIRYVKLNIYLPILDEALRLRGRVAWWDFHDARGTQPSFCMLGVAFHDFTDEAREEFLQILLNLEKHVETMEKAGG